MARVNQCAASLLVLVISLPVFSCDRGNANAERHRLEPGRTDKEDTPPNNVFFKLIRWIGSAAEHDDDNVYGSNPVMESGYEPIDVAQPQLYSQEDWKRAVELQASERKRFEALLSDDKRLPGTVSKQFLEEAHLVLDACERAASKVEKSSSSYDEAEAEIQKLYKPFSRRPDKNLPNSSQVVLVNVVLECDMRLSNARLVLLFGGLELHEQFKVKDWLRDELAWSHDYIDRLGEKYRETSPKPTVRHPNKH